jgi:hypothetical protein
MTLFDKTRFANWFWGIVTPLSLSVLIYISASFASINKGLSQGRAAYDDNKKQQEQIDELCEKINVQLIINMEYRKDIEYIKGTIQDIHKSLDLLLKLELEKNGRTK